MMARCSQTVEISLQNLDAVLRYRQIILLRDLYFTVAHLVTEQVRGCVQFCHHRSVSVPEVVILELDAQLLVDIP